MQGGVNSTSKEAAIHESRAGVRDGTENATEVEMFAENRRRTVSKVDVGSHLSEQDNEANTHEFETVKIGWFEQKNSRRLSVRKRVFREESSRAAFEVGNVELIELKSSIHSPLFLHHVC